jgi:hypothetical protein
MFSTKEMELARRYLTVDGRCRYIPVYKYAVSFKNVSHRFPSPELLSSLLLDVATVHVEFLCLPPWPFVRRRLPHPFPPLASDTSHHSSISLQM